ncbi:MAG: glycosyltransferase family 4 protein [Muribaculum sp.]|nr:glycosyltransferase family 4 protein [Muribaculum sp.]
MKVVYDHQVFSWQKFGGVSRYFVELIKHLPQDIEPQINPLLSENVYLDDIKDIATNVSKSGIANFRIRKHLYEWLNRMRSSKALKHGDYDLIHPTYYDPYFLKRRKAPAIVTVHDFIHERFPQYFGNASKVIKQKQRTINEADAIIAISEHTKKDLMEIYALPEEKISVVHHGATRPVDAEKVDYLPHRYVLFVGERRSYKNFHRFARAFALLAEKDNDLWLVCAGKPFSSEEVAFLKKLGIDNRSRAMFASDGQLTYLYQNALCFVYPSIYEGFGLPILEAWAAGCPIALSNASCFPEIAGDGGEYFDPLSHQSIADAISHVIYDTHHRDSLNQRATNRLPAFTWNRTAEQTVAVYRALTQ